MVSLNSQTSQNCCNTRASELDMSKSRHMQNDAQHLLFSLPWNTLAIPPPPGETVT